MDIFLGVVMASYFKIIANAALLFIINSSAFATCYEVKGYGTGNNRIPSGTPDAVAINWDGACGACQGHFHFGSHIVVNQDTDFMPYGTVLATSHLPFHVYGQRNNAYSPNLVFAWCAPEDPVYEVYATVGPYQWNGYYDGGDANGNSIGVPAAYRTYWPQILLQVKNERSGQYFTHIWKERRIPDSELDTIVVNGQTRKLIKGKNLTEITAKLIYAPVESGVNFPRRWGQAATAIEPSINVLIKGPGLRYPVVGEAYTRSNNEGYYSHWVAGAGFYRDSFIVNEGATCLVQSATPYVMFDKISVQEINSGHSITENFTLNMKCQTGVTSVINVQSGAPAFGFKMSEQASAAANQLGLVNPSGGSSYLISDKYGQLGQAEGVGIRILRENGQETMNLLTTETLGTGNAGGWYPIKGENSMESNVNGINYFSEVFSARLEKLQLGTMPAVKPGKIRATATVIVRVQ